MKKIDLHIHTVPTISDSHFDFSIEKLKEYIVTQKIDCIAITNHNKFDLDQFNTIVETLDITIFPGIEINFENGHLLLISDNNELEDFNSRCRQVEEQITDKEDTINISDLQSIFPQLDRYLLIPHYDKKPNVKQEVINQLSQYIKTGEVSSIKKFRYCLQDENSLTPVLFSDCRLTQKIIEFPIKQTYVDLETISFNGIKSCFNDKNKVFLSKKDGNNFFRATSDGLLLSTGLNIILGERSSGKTFTLDKIFKENEKVKYIKQFSLLKNDESEFKSKLATEEIEVTENYLREFKGVVDDISKVDLEANEKNIEKYLFSLIKYASETATADIFSKCAMYSESSFDIKNLSNLEKLIKSTEILIENEEYKDIIEKHVKKDVLITLFKDLIAKYYIEKDNILKKQWINDLIANIKRDLQTRSSQTSIEDIDLYKIALDNKKVEKFNEVVQQIKTEKEIYNKSIGKFNIVACTKQYQGAQELKAKSKRQWAFSDAFRIYNDDPYNYLQELKKVSDEMPETEYYKYFINIDYKILNSYGFEVSGGERAEYNLLNEIEDALKHDLLLIDEPESSFDNLFLKDEVNKLIKDLSKEIPIVIVTHNNTVGASIKPNYVLYTKREIDSGEVKYKIFSGYPSDKRLKTNSGEEIENYYIFMSCLEAGSDAYDERKRDLYEILKN